MRNFTTALIVFFLAAQSHATPTLSAEETLLKSFFPAFAPPSYELHEKQQHCKFLLQKISDPEIKERVSTLVMSLYPEDPSMRAELLKTLMRKKVVYSSIDFTKVEAALSDQRSTFKNQISLTRIEMLIDIANPEKKRERAEKLDRCKANISEFLYNSAQQSLLDESAPYNEAYVKVINHLGFWRKYWIDETKKQEQRLTDFIDFANSLPQDKGPKEHLPIWGSLAKCYLQIAVNAFTTDRQYTQCSRYFVSELQDFIEKRNTSYEWFILYCERLCILMTDPDDRDLDIVNASLGGAFNVKFDTYCYRLIQTMHQGKPSWYTDEGYRNAVMTTGSRYTQKLHSAIALCGDYPHTVMMPWPGDLSPVEILKTTPNPGINRLWLLGFLGNKTAADGSILSSPKFFAHDKVHKSIIDSFLTTSEFLFTDCEHFKPISRQEQWQNLREGRILFFEALSYSLSIIENAKEDAENPSKVSTPDFRKITDDQNIMDRFFFFYVIHEGLSGLELRLKSLVSLENNIYSLDGSLVFLLQDKLHYLPHLPEALQVQKGEVYERMYKDYARKFVEKFTKNTSLTERINAWLKSSRVLFSKPGTALRHDLTKVESFYDDSEKLMRSNGCDSNSRTTGMTCQNYKIMRRYFLGPVTYTGEEPPEIIEQTWSFKAAEKKG